jgi:hypothetical protein
MESLPVQSSQIHQLRNLLTVVLGGIETDNLPLTKQTIRRMNDTLTAYQEQDRGKVNAKEFTACIRTLGVEDHVLRNDLSFVLRRMAHTLIDARTNDGRRLNDQSDFREWLQELADEFKTSVI